MVTNKRLDAKVSRPDDPGRRRALAKVLKHGNPTVWREYESISETSKGLMLLSLDAMFMSAHMNFVQQRIVNQRKKKPLKLSKETCPLGTFLKTYTKTYPPSQEEFNVLKTKLLEWGIPSPFQNSPIWFMMRDVQTTKSFEKMKMEIKQKKMATMQNSVKHVTKTGPSNISWDKLSPMWISDLKAFEVSKGRVLHGKIICLPQSSAGITTFVRDGQGNSVQIGLYGFIPDNMNVIDSTEYAMKHITTGVEVSIAEPFMKIFADGNRGIRIDTPSEFRIHPKNALPNTLVTARDDGNALVKKKYYQAASNTYFGGLRAAWGKHGSFIPTVLSNRAQAFIGLEAWNEAMADAAAALVLRPSCEKSWQRYHKARDHILEVKDRAILFGSILDPSTWPHFRDFHGAKMTAEEYKAKGNTAFKNRDFKNAINCYTKALFVVGDDTRAILSNLSLCALETGAFHDAIATSSASLRFWSDDKAVHRLAKAIALLQEPSIALGVLNRYVASSHGSLDSLSKEIQKIDFCLARESIMGDAALMLHSNFPFLPDWSNPKVETYADLAKGRGIRAKEHIREGAAILFERPLSSFESVIPIVGSMGNIRFNADGTVIDDSLLLIQNALVHRVSHDQHLARRLNVLYDGVTSQPLQPIETMLDHLHDVPALLLSHSDYMPGESIRLAHDRIDHIVSINSFGSNKTGMTSCRSTSLYSAISIFNHAHNPNCVVVKLENYAFVRTTREITKGEALTISYGTASVVKKKWGIE